MKLKTEISLRDLKKHQFSIMLVVLTALAIWTIHVLWLRDGVLETDSMAARVAQQKQLIEKYEAKLGKAKGLRESLENQEKELGHLREGLYKGGDPYQLAASLGEVFSPKGSQDLSIKSYQVLDSKEYGLYQQVRLKFNFTASIRGLYSFLRGIEKSQTVLAVDQMDIRKGGGRGGLELVVNVIVSALMEKGERSDKNKT